MPGRRKAEIIKVKVPAWLAEKFRRYVAEKHSLKGGSETIDTIMGLGLQSDYPWRGEDLRRRTGLASNRC